MADRDRVLAYLAALVAAFVLAFLLGRVAAPALGPDEADDTGKHPAPRHSSMVVTP